jgi:hypothetical protein
MVEQTEEFMLKMNNDQQLPISRQKQITPPLLQNSSSLTNFKQFNRSRTLTSQNNDMLNSVLSNNNIGGGYFDSLSSKIIDDTNIETNNIVANKRVGPIQRPNAQRQQQDKSNSDQCGFSSKNNNYLKSQDHELLNGLDIWNQQLAEAAAASEASKIPSTNINTFNLLTNSFTYSQPSHNRYDFWNNPIDPPTTTQTANNGQSTWPSFHVDYLTNLIQTGEPQGPEQAPLTTDNLSYLWFTPSSSTNDNQFDMNTNTNTFDFNTTSSTLPWNSVLLNNLNDCLTISNDGNNIIDNSRATLESLWLNNEHEDDEFKI